MALRTLLVGLIIAATAAFIVGTTIERNSAHTEKRAAAKPAAHSGEGSSNHKEGGGGERPGGRMGAGRAGARSVIPWLV